MVDDNKETQVKTIEEYHEEAPRRWPMLVVYLIITLIVATLLVFGARAIYRHYHKTSVKTTSATTRPTFSGSSASGSSANKNNSSANSNKSNGSGASSTNGQVATSLPNSGPGQVMGLFVGATLAAAGLHYIVNLRRSSKAN